MKLYIGGVYQGQEELARAENPGLPCYPDFTRPSAAPSWRRIKTRANLPGSSAPRTRTPSSSRTKSARASCRL